MTVATSLIPPSPASVAEQPSVFARLRLLLAVVFAAGTTLALLAAWAFANAAANEAYDRLLVSAAVQMAEAVAVERNRVMIEVPDAAFETLAMAADDRIFYAVRAPSGRLMTGYPEVPAPEADGPPFETRIEDGVVMGERVRMVTAWRYVSTARPGWISIVIAQTRIERRAMAWSMIARVGSLIVLVGALGFFGALGAARRVLRPLARIEHALSERDDNDVTPLRVDSPREARALVDAINVVMARLGERAAKLQSFAGLAAHQVRTPIAALLAQVELLRGDPTEQARDARIDRLRDRLVYLGRLTNQLLDHAMVSYRAETVSWRPVDLVAIARTALRDGVPMSLSRDVAILLDNRESRIMVRGDDVTLREAVTNLVNNAVVHGAPSSLSVIVRRIGDRASVTVYDDGPGISPDQWETICTPFASARDERPGAGLGLSIVREIARVHGGDLSFDRPPAGGFSATIDLPSEGGR